jgi:hypothetical protein
MLTHMDEARAKHWFRFRLSTVLILTAIAAWGMATSKTHNDQFPNPHLAWPALTLAVFVGWRSAWATPDENRRVRPWLMVGGLGAMCSVATMYVARQISFADMNQSITMLVGGTLIVLFYLGPLIFFTAITGLLVTLWRLSEDP